jgi:hypothetical protein
VHEGRNETWNVRRKQGGEKDEPGVCPCWGESGIACAVSRMATQAETNDEVFIVLSSYERALVHV